MYSKTSSAVFKLTFAATVVGFVNFNSLSKAEILVSDKAPCQGETIEIGVNESTYSFNGKTYKAFPKTNASRSGTDSGAEVAAGTENATEGRSKAAFVGLIAIPADLDPGKYSIKSGAETETLSVHSGKFVLQHINLPKSKDNFESSPGEKEAIDSAKSVVSDARLWDGKFQAPSKARVSATFGIKRISNGKLLKDYYHSGIDYAGMLGSPITACGDGKVILVGQNWRLHGNCVCLDHGQGVISIYIHMQKVLVKSGQLVHKGETIGRIGATGRATGPHLHFSLYVNESAANPNDWYQKAF